ncbi:AT-hook motif nuclear-localized protein 7-like, partial [Neltuma alba]|uniref:AT-hook motif nuclear-localized protein 7-like n=1 Tax=Neltuma alba TaxID=207710 RepID=UPI0010A4767F
RNFSATAGGSFIPHVVIVNPGEDVANNILSFSNKSPRALCILSAIGAVSIVDIQQPDSSGRCLRYEGLFEIITLSGSYTYGGIGGDMHRKSLTMRISLAQPDGKIFGGGVGGSLIAAGPIQLILGSFKQNISSEIKRRLSPGSSGAADMPGDSDSVRLSLQVPKLIESEQSFPSPTSGLMPTSNGLPDHVMPRTSNGLSDNVTAATANGNGLPDFFTPNQSMQSTSLNGAGLDCQVLQPFPDPMTFGDINNRVSQM